MPDAYQSARDAARQDVRRTWRDSNPSLADEKTRDLTLLYDLERLRRGLDELGIPYDDRSPMEAALVRLRALKSILADREHELLVEKGPCSKRGCRLHRAHSGPCDIQ